MSRRLSAVAAVFAMVLVSAFTLGSLVAPGLWLPRTLLCVGVALVVTTALRSRTLSAGIPSLVGLLAGLLATAAVFFPEDALLGVLPTQATVRSIGETIPVALQQMRTSYPPIQNGDGVALFVVVGVLVVLVLTEMLAIGAWAPAWSGLPVLGLWCVPVTLGAGVDAITLALAGVAYVLVIAIQARDDARYRRRPDGRGARAIAVVAASTLVAGFAVAPSLLRIPVPIRWHPVYELVGSSTTRLDLGLGMRDDLLRNEPVDLFSYTGADPDDVGPLHAYTVTEFDGSSWLRSTGGELVASEGQVLWPSSLDGVATGEPFDVEISVANLGQDRLLLPGEPRELDADVGVDYLADSDEAIAYVGGQVSYDVTIVPRRLDGETLAALQPATGAPEELLEVPETGYQADIAELARSIVADAGAETPYEQLLAIQNYLRDPARFVYSTSIASPETPDAVWDFLADRHGYCVQFATAMIVMARTLGMPARLAVGFLPGDADPDGVATVTSHDAHAWPQVLFDGVGWVRFEPTPGVQAGPPPEYAPEQIATATAQPSTAAPTAATTPGSPGASTSRPAGSSGSDDEPASRAPWVIVLGALVAVAVAASVLAGRRARLQPTNLHERWDQVLLHLDRLGVDVARTRTPRAIAHDAAAVLDDDGLVALESLASAVEAFSYGRDDAPRPDDAEVRMWVDAVVESTRRALREQRETAGV